MIAVPSGYFPCVAPLMFVATGSLFLLAEFLSTKNFSYRYRYR